MKELFTTEDKFEDKTEDKFEKIEDALTSTEYAEADECSESAAEGCDCAEDSAEELISKEEDVIAESEDKSVEPECIVSECVEPECTDEAVSAVDETVESIMEVESIVETEACGGGVIDESAVADEEETGSDEENAKQNEEFLETQFKQMRFSNITAKIDLDCTLPTVTSSEIAERAEKTKTYGFKSVCILASRMKLFKKQSKEQNFCAVIAYPSGEMTERSKLCEIKEAVSNGASEVDVFFRISALKDEKRKLIVRSLTKYAKAIGKNRTYKLSFDCSMANEEEARFIVSAAVEAKVDYIVVRNCKPTDVRTQLFYAELCSGRCKLQFADSAFDLSSITRLSDVGADRFLLTDAFDVADRIKREVCGANE